MKDRTILVVDDESDLLEMVRSIFERAGFTNILTAASGKEALKIWKDRQPDMIILDIMMPGIDGLSILKQVRETSNIPVLLLTARGEAEDRVTGFESGADDYLIKPFHPKELLLRVQVILNRAYPQKERKIYLEAATIDLEKAEVQRGKRQFLLTGKELTLLEKLAENAGRIVTTGSLCGAVCGEFWRGYESTLSTHIRHLREKIEENPSKPVSLVTIKGVGYRLNIKGRNDEYGRTLLSPLYIFHHRNYCAFLCCQSVVGRRFFHHCLSEWCSRFQFSYRGFFQAYNYSR